MSRVMMIVFYVVIAAVAIVSLVFILPASHRLNQMKSRVAQLEEELAARRREAVEMEQFLRDLRDNPRAVEKVAREKFGLCRPDEVIYLYTGPREGAPAPAPAPQ